MILSVVPAVVFPILPCEIRVQC